MNTRRALTLMGSALLGVGIGWGECALEERARMERLWDDFFWGQAPITSAEDIKAVRRLASEDLDCSAGALHPGMRGNGAFVGCGDRYERYWRPDGKEWKRFGG
jgi:hypothetical protein